MGRKGANARRGYPKKKKKKKKNGNDTISRPVIKGRFLPGYEYEHDRRVERLDVNVYIYILIL